jgi:hypothetical protein
MMLEADLVLELTVEIGDWKVVGKTPKGCLRLIPITGGVFTGKNIKGKVVPGGYDWNTVVNENVTHALAKYAIQTDDGEYISVENEGYLESGKDNKIITTPSFQASEDGKYGWLNYGVYVGSLEAGKTKMDVLCVYIKIFKML